MFEKEAEERFVKSYPEFCYNGKPLSPYWDLWQDGAEFGYNKAMKEWRACFMSCSSPYCADKFRDIQCGGILGNMTKGGSMRKSRWKESEKYANNIIKRLEKLGLSVRLYEVPVAMDEPDICFKLYAKGSYITSVFELFEMENIAMILEGLND